MKTYLQCSHILHKIHPYRCTYRPPPSDILLDCRCNLGSETTCCTNKHITEEQLFTQLASNSTSTCTADNMADKLTRWWFLVQERLVGWVVQKLYTSSSAEHSYSHTEKSALANSDWRWFLDYLCPQIYDIQHRRNTEWFLSSRYLKREKVKIKMASEGSR